MEFEIDIDQLREDMLNNYGTAMFNGFPMSLVDIQKIEKATDDELVIMAKKEKINMFEYRM